MNLEVQPLLLSQATLQNFTNLILNYSACLPKSSPKHESTSEVIISPFPQTFCMSMKVYVSHHIQPIDKDTWHLPHQKCVCCILAGENLLLHKVACAHAAGSGVWGGMGQHRSSAAPSMLSWEDHLLMGIIRKAAAWGGLKTAPVYLKVMCLITLLTWFSMWDSMKIFWDIPSFFSYGFKLIWYSYINSLCTLEEYNSELSYATEG